MRNNVEHLKSRWRGQSIDSSSASPFGLVPSGKTDYRGASAESKTFENAVFSNADFTHGNLMNCRFTDCRFEDCTFERTNLVRTFVKNCDFTNCDFSHADFRQSLFGVFGTRVRECVFDGVRTANFSPTNPVFENCNFQGQDWKNVRFWAAGFWNCSFTGELSGVEFNGHGLFQFYKDRLGSPVRSGLHDVSFKTARLTLVGCKDGCELENVQMPLDGSSFIGDVASILALEEQLDTQPELRSVLRKYFTINYLHPDAQPRQIISRGDLDNLCEHQLADSLYGILRTKTAIC
jgi:hypothetical protein